MSPVVLMLSGIGTKENLEKYQIPLKKDLPVGKNLIDYIGTLTFFQFDPSTKEPIISAYDDTYNLAIHNTGRLTIRTQPTLAAIINTDKMEKYPNIQIAFQYSYIFSKIKILKSLRNLRILININILLQ